VLIVKSANDVAVMIAETVAGSEKAFVARMNEAALHHVRFGSLADKPKAKTNPPMGW
jgi:hypothetical protein